MEGYVKKSCNSVQALIRKDIAAACPGEDLDNFCHSLFDEPPAGQLIKRGSYKTIYRSEFGNNLCIIKTYKNKGMLGLLKSAAVPSRARQEFTAAAYIHRQGILTAAPLILAEKKTLGMVSDSAVVLEFIEGAQELRDFFFYDRSILPAERRLVAEQFGRLTAAIFQKGVFQYDFALNNFLIRREADGFRLCFIDFERVRLKRAVSREQKIDALARLGRVGAEISLKDRLRFLRGYLAQEPGFAPSLQAFAAEMIGGTVAAIRHDLARGRTTSIYTHARYDRIQQDGRTGLCKKGTDLPVLVSAVSALSGREPAGQLIIRHEGKSLVMRAVYLEPQEAEAAWAVFTALIIAGMPSGLPHALVCSEITGCLLLEPSMRPACERFLTAGSRSARFITQYFPSEVELLKSLLAKI
jgi:tRNA A-37 threonylcarbamoyl transferase component Bud32